MQSSQTRCEIFARFCLPDDSDQRILRECVAHNHRCAKRDEFSLSSFHHTSNRLNDSRQRL